MFCQTADFMSAGSRQFIVEGHGSPWSFYVRNLKLGRICGSEFSAKPSIVARDDGDTYTV